MAGSVRPRAGATRCAAWRLTAPSVKFMDIKNQFKAAGVTLQAYNMSFNDSFTDLEIEKGFDQAQALGVEASSPRRRT